MHTSSTTQLRMEGKVHDDDDDDDYDYDYNNDVVGAATMNSDEILLLRRIEDDSIGVGGPGGAAGSVSTADLLDMLDREVSANHNHSQTSNRNHSSGGSKGRVRARNDGGYSSGDTTRSSFTSRLLGGQTDDDLVGVGVDIGVGVVPAAGRASSNDSDVVFGADDASVTRPLTNDSSHSLQGSIDGSVSSSSLYHKYKSVSDASASKLAADGTRLSRQSFDNPFRSRARIGGGSFSDQSRDDGSTSAASASSLGKLLDSGGGGRRPRGQNSVTFSIQEGSRGENSTQSSDVVQPSPGSIDGAGHHPVSVSTRSSRQSSKSSKSSKSSRSSRSSHGSATTASTHSSGDSLQERRRRRELVPVKDRPSSDHRHRRARKSPAATATATATDGLSKWQPIRNRKRGSTGAGDGVGESSRIPYGNRRAAGRVGGGGSDVDDDDDDDDSDGDGGAYHGKNLHDHHPVRYPKRSSYCDNGGGGSNRSNEDENEEEDDVVVPLARCRAGGSGDDDASNDEDEDEDGLFRRVGRVRDGDDGAGLKDGDFLDGLIASTTAARAGGGGRLGSFDDGDDAVSVGETSFLSELLASNNAARHRGGLRRSVAGSVASVNTSGQSLGATTLTSHTDNSSEKMDFVNIYSVDANNKQQKRRQRSHHSRWRVNTATIRQHCDRVATKVRQSRAFRRMEQCFNEGSDALPQSVRQSHAFRRMERCYHEGGEVLPQNRMEIAMFLVCGLLLWPLVHVAIIIATGGGDAGGGRSGNVGRNGGGYFGGEIQFVDSSGRKKQLGGRLGSRTQNKKGTEIDGIGQTPLYSMGESMNAWAGSSQVMLSKYSSLRENFILIPDADWIELQIIRSKAASMQSSSDGGFLSNFFQKSSSTYDALRKPPKRLPLPSTIDPVYNSTASMVLFSITPMSKDAKYANTILWQAIRRSLRPRPIDVWPCWSHNSLAQFREDGYTVMYPYSMRQEARMGLTKLAKNLGQSILYEYITWSESSSHADVGGGDTIRGRGEGGSIEERAGSVRLVGKDGSAIVIPALPNGRSDIMIRRTLSTDPSSSDAGQEPAVVMRRVKDLPVEDELTMREWEGPPLEKIALK